MEKRRPWVVFQRRVSHPVRYGWIMADLLVYTWNPVRSGWVVVNLDGPGPRMEHVVGRGWMWFVDISGVL